jgi:hypothetical protein
VIAKAANIIEDTDRFVYTHHVFELVGRPVLTVVFAEAVFLPDRIKRELAKIRTPGEGTIELSDGDVEIIQKLHDRHHRIVSGNATGSEQRLMQDSMRRYG